MEENKIEEFEKEKRSIKIKYIIIMIIVALCVAVISSEFTMFYYTRNLFEKEDVAQNADENIEAIAETLKNFRSIINQTYVGYTEIDEQKMMDETIKGYVNGLGDEYSEYMTAKEWEEYQADSLGNYVGIGIYMSTDKNGNVVVVSPIKDTPAEEAGLESGDIIVYVNDERLDMTPKEYELLTYLIKNENMAIKREELLSKVWGYDFFGDDRTLDTHMKLLRRKLGEYGKNIITLRGVGYRFEK